MGPQRVRHEWQTLTSLHFFSLPWSCHSASPYQTFGCLLSCNLGGNLESNPEGSCRSSNICNYCPVFYKKKKKQQSFDLGIITIIYTLHEHLKIPLLGLPWWFSGPRIRLPMQETLAWSLNQEDPPHATGQLSIRTTTTESALCSRGAAATERMRPRPRARQRKKPLATRSPETAVKSSPRLLKLEKSPHSKTHHNSLFGLLLLISKVVLADLRTKVHSSSLWLLCHHLHQTVY